MNTDRGTQFYSTKDKSSQFEEYLKEKRIRYIPSRKNNPQTNGKLERFWYEYDKHRFSFRDIQQFIDWYNSGIHGALWLEIAEKSKEASSRKFIGFIYKINREIK